jgi:Protein of unknown function (DUF3267).
VKETLREALFDSTRKHLEEEGYTAQECTISVLKANLMALVTAAPLALLCGVLFFYLYPNQTSDFFLSDLFIFIGGWIASMALHELLHGLGWSLFCQKGWKSIYLGVMWSKLTPYCGCLEALPFGPYLLGGLMPLIVLGIGAFAVAAFTGSLLWFALSALNMVAAGGDLTIALLLLRHRNARIVDHPTKCGFWAFSRKEALGNDAALKGGRPH